MGTLKEKLLKLSQTPKQKKSQNLKTICLVVLTHQVLKILLAFFASPREMGLKFLDFLHFGTVKAHVNSQLFILSEIRF